MNLSQLQRLLRLRNDIIPKLNINNLRFDEWESNCGTFMCLAGHSAYDETFNRMGLILTDGGDPFLNAEEYERLYIGFEALERFFGLSPSICREIFGMKGMTNVDGEEDIIAGLEYRIFLIDQEIMKYYESPLEAA